MGARASRFLGKETGLRAQGLRFGVCLSKVFAAKESGSPSSTATDGNLGAPA